MITRMTFKGGPSGCRKIKPELDPRKALAIFEKLSSLSIRDLERTAKKGRSDGKVTDETLRSTAVNVLIKKYNINEVRSAVKDSLIRLSKLDNEVGTLAKDALKKFKESETRKQPVSLNSANIKTIEEFRRENNIKSESKTTKTQKKGKRDK